MKKEVIIWTKKLSVGIKEIDEQHKHFMGIMNSIYSKRKMANEKVEEDLNNLIEYARIHFSTEERYFSKFNYPYAREHIIEHQKITLQVLKFKQRFDSGEAVTLELILFVKDWLTNHLKVYDFKYAKYFKEHNLI
jgi:hemerythrin-like metal-binding protein